jgi:predicted acylesterase/phospholipase RssA/CRP-like cAMP-binding protein
VGKRDNGEGQKDDSLIAAGESQRKRWMSETSLLIHLASNDLFKDLDQAILKELEGELEPLHLNRDEILFKQGEPGDSMYVLIKGRIAVRMRTAGGREIVVAEESKPGTSVGEMALITGQARVVTICAESEADLVRLSKEGFEFLVRKRPRTLAELAETTSRRWRRAQLAVVLTNLLGEFDAGALQDLQSELEWYQLSHGEILFSQGDPGEAMYIVVNGRLRIVAVLPDGSESELDEIGAGEIVGEFALITGEARTATVYAIRQTHLVRLSQPLFTRLVARHPQAMMRIARKIVHRHPSSLRVSAVERISAFNLALIPINQDVPLDEFSQNLAAGLESFGRILHLSSACLDRIYGQEGAAQTPLDDPTAPILDSWMSEQETKFQYILYAADPDWSTWTRRCLRQADKILIVGQSGADPTPDLLELGLDSLGVSARTELVLLHPASVTRPSGTSDWLSRRQIHTHHHVREGDSGCIQRLVRRLTGRPTGLVLSGGAARGFAHLGVFRALEELGIQFDFVGGTSMGALMSASYAMGRSYEQMVELAREFASPRRLFDYTLPLTSLMSSKKATNALMELFGDLHIEDLWHPYFCVSSNLSRAETKIHRTGLLWKAIRASTAIPGIFTPILYDGELFVDGGAMNNFPVDIMRQSCDGGTVVGVNVSQAHETAEAYHFGTSLSGWQVLWSRVNPFYERIQAPSLAANLVRSLEISSASQIMTGERLADVVIKPDVSQFGMLDFAAYEEISEAGYQAAWKPLSRWQSQREQAGKP